MIVLIYIINLPNPESQLINLSLEEGSIITNQSYYFPPINVWNGVHHNAVPLINDNRKEVINDYTSSQAGLSRQVKDDSTSIPLNPIDSKIFFAKFNFAFSFF